jgi:hypothetical protein
MQFVEWTKAFGISYFLRKFALVLKLPLIFSGMRFKTIEE